MRHRSTLNLLAAAAMAALAGFTSNAKAVTVGNASFENYDTLSHSDQSAPWGGPTGDTAVAVWDFTFEAGNIDSCGINTNGGPWWIASAPAPDGIRGGYMQNANSRIAQDVIFNAPGDYVVTFSTIGRNGGGAWTIGRELTVKIGDTPVLVIPASEIGVNAWQNRVSTVFTATAGTHTLSFVTGGGGDATAIDNVAIELAGAGQADMLGCTFPDLGTATIDQDTRVVTIAVPHGTFVDNLAPTFTLSPLATINPASGTERDFSTPKIYTVTSGDSSLSKTYTVTVTVTPPSTACDILTFGLPDNPAFIDGTSIELTVPFVTDLELLAPQFTISPNAWCDQSSGGIPTPDFSTGPVPYVVTAEDGITKKTYTVTVIKDPPTEVKFTLTPLGKAADSTGSEILNTGIPVAAFHFGNGPVDTTVAGVVFTAGNFGTGPSYPATGLTGSSNGMKGWLSGQLGFSFTNAAYAELIDQAYVGGSPVMDIGGLTIDHEYRLQIILQDTRGTPTIEGVAGPALTPGNPGIITATWVAKDDTLNVSWSGGASPHFSGYVLHDLGGSAGYDYVTWAENFPAADLSDPEADFDRDGLSNDAERLFGLDPTSGSSLTPFTVPFDPATGTFSFTRRDDALTGRFSRVETSPDLLMWTEDTGAVLVAGDPDGDDIEIVSVSLSEGLLSAPVLFVRVVQDDGVIFSANFENNDGGFTVDTAQGTGWAWGPPDASGAGGTVTTGNGGSINCWATNLGDVSGSGDEGFYANPTSTCLRSPLIDLTGVAAAQLSFAQAVDLEAGDSATVNLLDAGGNPIIGGAFPLTVTDSDITIADWKAVGPVALPAAALGQQVRLEWCLSGQADQYFGWFVDDVTVRRTVTP